MKKNHVTLTFDIEEFDLPLQHGLHIPMHKQMAIGLEGLKVVEEIINNISCTLFTTANFALKYPSKISGLSKTHEIGSHTFFHSSFRPEDLLNSRQVLEDIISKNVFGLRMPRMKKIEAGAVRKAGYSYNSFVNPTWIPGRRNNFSLPRTSYMENGIIRVPVSVSPNFRIPLFWLAFKNLPYSYFKKLVLQSLRKDGYLSLYFHTWEFADLKEYNLPAIIRKKSGEELQEKLYRLVKDLAMEGEFITMQEHLEACYYGSLYSKENAYLTYG